MRQITIAFAAVAITALFAAPVSAEKLADRANSSGNGRENPLRVDRLYI